MYIKYMYKRINKKSDILKDDIMTNNTINNTSSISREELLRLVHDHLLGMASDTDEARLQRWATADTRNAALLERLMRRTDLADRYRLYDETDDEAAWQRFHSDHPEIAGHRPTLRRWRWVAAAAVVVVIVGAATLFYNSRQGDAVKPAAALAQTEAVALSPASEHAAKEAIRTGRQEATVEADGETCQVATPEEYAEMLATTPAKKTLRMTTNGSHEYWLTLSDGTRVHLDGSSTLTYPAQFTDGRREVLLDGMAYFKVAHQYDNTDSRFIVATRQGLITDLGTEFVVNTRAKAGTTEVVLLSGRVSVQPNSGTAVMMQPGQKAEMRAGAAQLGDADLDFYKAWNEGEMLFQDTPLSEVMHIVELWYDVDVSFQNPDLGNTAVTGSVDRYASLQAILKAVSAVTGVRITRQGNTVVVE